MTMSDQGRSGKSWVPQVALLTAGGLLGIALSWVMFQGVGVAFPSFPIQVSLEEMQRGAEIAPAQQRAWLTAMQRCFPDVVEGDRMTGVQLPGTAARFFVNGAFVGEVRDAEFTRLFFGIWLAPTTSEPELRAALLAGARGGS